MEHRQYMAEEHIKILENIIYNISFFLSQNTCLGNLWKARGIGHRKIK